METGLAVHETFMSGGEVEVLGVVLDAARWRTPCCIVEELEPEAVVVALAPQGCCAVVALEASQA